FGALFLGIGFLSGVIGIVPDPTEVETVHSQLTRTLLGSGPLHAIIEGAALLLLILAADTGFADFPRLLSLLANDGYLPHAFAVRGARLAFSNGIVLVTVISALLILIFRGSVEALRSEEHTSELQSRGHLVCRLLLEKKKTTTH